MIDRYWSEALAANLAEGRAVVLITQIGERGSSPRSLGTKMVVTEDEEFDSLGGGNLEHQSIQYARELIAAGTDGLFERSYTLAGELGQCCGGEVRVLFEVYNASIPELYVFGAGHIAKALIPLVAQLSFRVRWIDEREELFTDPIPKGVERLERIPQDVASSIPDGAWVLVMTHDHGLDFDLVKACLERNNFEYLGVIGSDTKALKFRQRLEQRGFSEGMIARMHAPIGLSAIKTKRPYEVAISIAADLLSRTKQEST